MLTLFARLLRELPRIALGLFGILLLIGMLPGMSNGQNLPQDPVEELKQALKLDPPPYSDKAEDKNRTMEQIKFREENLRRVIKKMKDSMGDMSRALLLRDWLVDLVVAEIGGTIDRKIYKELTTQFIDKTKKVLASKDENARIAAAFLLGQTAVEGRSLQNRTNELRDTIGMQMGPELIKLLEAASSPNVRAAAAVALGLIEPDVAIAVPALEKGLGDTNELVRRGAARGLGEILSTLVQLDLELRSPKSELGEIERYGSVLDQIREASRRTLRAVAQEGRGLGDADVQVRRLSAASCQILSEFLQKRILYPTKPEDLNPAESTLELKDSEKKRLASLRDRASLSPELRPLTKEDEKLLEKLGVEMDYQLADLEKVLAAARTNAAAIARAVNDSDRMVSVRVRKALEDLADTRQRLRTLEETMTLMGRPIKPVPRPAVPKKILRQPTPGAGVIQAVALAPAENPILEEPEATLNALRQGLSSPDAQARVAAVHALELMGLEAAPAIPELIKVLKDSDFAVRWAAVRALGKMHLEAEQVVPALIPLLSDRDVDVAVAAAVAVKRFGEKAAGAVETIGQALQTNEPDIRIALMEALEAIGLKALPVLPTAVGMLKDTNWRVRKTAAWLLGRFGPRAHDAAAETLRSMLQDENPEVRRAVSDALLSVEREKEKESEK